MALLRPLADFGCGFNLASVDVMAHPLVDHLGSGSRHALLGISNSVVLAQITANRALDQIDPPE